MRLRSGAVRNVCSAAVNGTAYSFHVPGGGVVIVNWKSLPQFQIRVSSTHAAAAPVASVSGIGKPTSTGTLLFIQNLTPPVALASYGCAASPSPFSENPIAAPQSVNPKPVMCAAWRLPLRPSGIRLCVKSPVGEMFVLVLSVIVYQAPVRPLDAQMKRSPSSMSSIIGGSPPPPVGFDPPPHPVYATTSSVVVRRRLIARPPARAPTPGRPSAGSCPPSRRPRRRPVRSPR